MPKSQNPNEPVFCESDVLLEKSAVLNKFELGKHPKFSLFSTISVYGRRRSGKSVFVKWFIQEVRHEIPWWWVFTLTGFNSYYSSFIPEQYIIPEFNADMLELIMHRQKIAIQTDNKYKNINPRIGIIWDDYMGDDVTYNQKLKEYYATGRHYRGLNIYCAQYLKMTPPTIRTNSDIVILFDTDYKDSMRDYHDCFAGKIRYEVFMCLYRQATSVSNGFLAIDCTPGVDYGQKFFQGHAELLPPTIDYIMGCWEFWKDNLTQMREIERGVHEENSKRASDQAEHVHLSEQSKIKNQDNYSTFKTNDDADFNRSITNSIGGRTHNTAYF